MRVQSKEFNAKYYNDADKQATYNKSSRRSEKSGIKKCIKKKSTQRKLNHKKEKMH